ncbi:MFS transporter [Microbacterium sp. NPDC056569]|uniref:MFS transporter n=1 Tax=Microbacterium sp. NPDC056569 TaxID=3345867 RepID=UPI00366CA0F9
MTTPTSAGTRTARGPAILFIPTLIALELFGGLIQGWITPLLGEIGTHYTVPDGALSWILTVGLLSSAVSVPFMTMLADRFGARRLLVVAAALTAAGSALIALAPTFPLLILGAVVQGPVAALLPLEMALLKRHRPASANRVVGILVGTLTLGVAIGSLTAGFVMEAVGSLVVTQFIGAVPLIVLAIAVGFTVPPTPGDPARTTDWAGATTFAIALVGIMYGLSSGTSEGWTAAVTIGCLAVGAVGLIIFCVVEARAANPLFDVRVLRTARLGVPLVLGVLVAMTMFGSQTPTVLYLSADPAVDGYGTGATVAVVGVVFALTALCSSAGAFLSPLVVRRLGVPATISASCIVMAAGMVVLITAPTNVVIVAALFGVTALGTGVVLAALPAVVIDRAPEEASATVSGLYNTGRTLGGSLAGALVAAIITAFTHPASDGVPTTTFAAFQVVWIVFAAILVVAAGLALTLGGRRAPCAAPAAEDPATIGAAS